MLWERHKEQGEWRILFLAYLPSLPQSLFQWWWTLAVDVQWLAKDTTLCPTSQAWAGVWDDSHEHAGLEAGMFPHLAGIGITYSCLWEQTFQWDSMRQRRDDAHSSYINSLPYTNRISCCQLYVFPWFLHFLIPWCCHRWWLSLQHITSGSGSALCTTAELWGITMTKCSCPEDPVLLLQTACSVGRKADSYGSDYHPPPHPLTLGRWWNYVHPRNQRTPFQLKKCSSTLPLIKPKVWFTIVNKFPLV